MSQTERHVSLLREAESQGCYGSPDQRSLPPCTLETLPPPNIALRVVADHLRVISHGGGQLGPMTCYQLPVSYLAIQYGRPPFTLNSLF